MVASVGQRGAPPEPLGVPVAANCRRCKPARRCITQLLSVTLAHVRFATKSPHKIDVGPHTVDAAVGDGDGDEVRQEHGQPDRKRRQDLVRTTVSVHHGAHGYRWPTT